MRESLARWATSAGGGLSFATYWTPYPSRTLTFPRGSIPTTRLPACANISTSFATIISSRNRRQREAGSLVEAKSLLPTWRHCVEKMRGRAPTSTTCVARWSVRETPALGCATNRRGRRRGVMWRYRQWPSEWWSETRRCPSNGDIRSRSIVGSITRPHTSRRRNWVSVSWKKR